MSTEILRNIPHIVYFATTDTPDSAVVTYIHTDATVTVSAIVQHGLTDHYQVVFTPTTCGPWIISIYNAGGDVLHSESFECVNATKAQNALGLQPPYHGLVDVWPTKVWKSTGAKSDLLVASGTPRTWCGVGKHVVPYDGFIYGIKFVGHPNLADFDSVQFVSMYSESTDKLTLRSISEDIHAKTPTDGAWDGTNFLTIYFDKPVYAERGDSFGFYGSQSSGTDKVIGIMQEVNTASQTPQETRYISGVLNLTAENTTTRDGADPGQRKMILCKLMMEPPAIVIGGHSFWSGGFISGDALKSNSVFEDWSVGYNRLGDCASILSDILGVPCCNCADGGTSIVGWTGSSGNFATVVSLLRPTLFVYDTAYNDKDSGTFGGDPTLYPEYLGRLLAQCDQIGAQLILLESPPSRYATTMGRADELEAFNAVAMLWAQHNGVPYVALHHRLGQHSGGDEHDSLRRYQKNSISGVSDYNSSTDSYIHPTVAAQHAAMLALGEVCRFRVPQPRITAPTTTYDEVIPENTIMKTGSSDTVTTDAASREASKATGFATPTHVSDAASALESHGDTNWSTASGFATPENLNDIAVAIDGHITGHITESVGSLATSTELAAVDAKIDDVLEDTGTTLPAAITGVWTADDRTLTGGGGTSAPTAQTEDEDAHVSVKKGFTRLMRRRVRKWNSDDITQDYISTITYTAYLLDGHDADERTAITGHTAVSVSKVDVIYDTLQTDNYSADWNFSHIPEVDDAPLFTIAGRMYLVEYTITPTDGSQEIPVRFFVSCI